MHYDLIIQNGTLVDSKGSQEADLCISDGKIVRVGRAEASDSSEQVLDAHGLTVIPGVIDTQVHFREPGLEHKEDIGTGTRAAVMGGVTTIFEMPNTMPPTTSEEALNDKLRRAAEKAWCNYGFFIGGASDNANDLARLEMLPGTPGVKIFVGSSTGTLLVDDEELLRQVLRNGKRRCPIHSEDETRNRERKAAMAAGAPVSDHWIIRDAESARISTQRVLGLSKEIGRPVHILHLSTLNELPLIEQAKKENFGTTCEVTPQHLYFSAPEAYDRLGSKVQQNPPIRSEEHRQALWRAVRAGLIDVFGSDHAPHTLEEKAKTYPDSPSGMPGVQTMLPVLLDFVSKGLLSLHDVVRMACEHPALIYGIKNKGFLREGFDADIAIIDPTKKQAFGPNLNQSRCSWSPFDGIELIGWPLHVVVRGHVVVRDQAISGPRCGHMVEFDWK